jgi:hypothetical protein
MDRAERFLIEAMSSNGSTFLSFVYAIFYFVKRRWMSSDRVQEARTDRSGSSET